MRSPLLGALVAVVALAAFFAGGNAWLDGFVRPDGWSAAVVELRNTGAPTVGELVLDGQRDLHLIADVCFRPFKIPHDTGRGVSDCGFHACEALAHLNFFAVI